MRHDGDSSADEENKLKDYLRREARQERRVEKDAKNVEQQRVQDMKTIEELNFNKEAIPQNLKERYQDEMSELQSYDYKKK